MMPVRNGAVRDRLRPQFHFLPPSNWMNDPNGVIQWKGVYHLFYQYNPGGPQWGNIHWGHAYSSDLVHWTDAAIALAPTPGGPDEAGCFSGCAVDNGLPTLVYTGASGDGHGIQAQCLATSADDLVTWTKYPGNPVLSQVPREAGQTNDFRDPFVWREGDTWYMVLGSRINDVGGAVFLYRSPDLIQWEYLRPLLVGDGKRNGAVWECPNFFKLHDQWVLIISSQTGPVSTLIYFVGSYEHHTFTPRHEGVLDYGHLYAALTMFDAQDRRLLFAWVREARSAEDQRLAGWSGVQAIPRVLALDTQSRLTMKPVAELALIRGRHRQYAFGALTEDTALDVEGLSLDIVAEFEPGADGACGIAIACSADGRERTEIVYEAARQCLAVRQVTSEQRDAEVNHPQEAPLALGEGETLKLRILLDNSVVEIIANDRTSLVSRIYPNDPVRTRLYLLGTGAPLRSLDIWEMPSIWG